MKRGMEPFLVLNRISAYCIIADVLNSGPSSVGMDLSLHGFNHTYGLPEHADTLVLKDTR